MPSPTSAAFRASQLVLHIGSGKTGTSSIQHLLDQNRERLAERGLLYPRSPGTRRHVRFGLFLRSDEDLNGQLSWHAQKQRSPEKFRRSVERRLLEELDRSGLSRLLISDEALYGLSNEALRRLRTWAVRIADTTRVVVYLRRQDDHLCSRYQQIIKTGEVLRLEERLKQMDFAKIYDYRARLQAWQQWAEPDELVVRPFERERFEDGSLYQDFLTAVGLDTRLDDLEQIRSRNESLDAESVEFLRILNLYRVENEGAKPGLINNRDLVVRLAHHSTGPTLTLPDPVLDQFMTTWEESNCAVARDFLADGTGQLFRSPRKSRNTTTVQRLDPSRLDHYLTLAEIPEHIHAPLRRLAEREIRTT